MGFFYALVFFRVPECFRFNLLLVTVMNNQYTVIRFVDQFFSIGPARLTQIIAAHVPRPQAVL